MERSGRTDNVLGHDPQLRTAAQGLLESSNYAAPTRDCDLVMKGGVTSGVVYPWAICELARTHRLYGLGGASAGAIAAAGAAAAEYRRRSGHSDPNGGFVALAEVPLHLATDQHLSRLFRPQRGGRRLFRVLFPAGRTGLPRALREFAPTLLLGAIPGALAIALGIKGHGVMAIAVIVCGLIIALLGSVLAALIDLMLVVSRRLPRNLLGLCTGLSNADHEPPAMTEWLHEVLQRIAGLPPDAAPLTFGDLTRHDVDLRLMVTCLTLGRPYVAPNLPRTYYFHETEMRRLFPSVVVDALVRSASSAGSAPSEATDASDATDDASSVPGPTTEQQHRSARAAGLLPLPAPAELPVVVAARISLSFPLLFSPIPLWTVDHLRAENRRAPDDETKQLFFERVWFADGGITSNFPVNVFDRALPTRPTFAIDLQGFPAGRIPTPDRPDDEVWLPRGNNSGWQDIMRHRIEPRPSQDQPQIPGAVDTGFGRISSLLGAVVNTGRTWVDSVAITQPGTRDRVARVYQTDDEGGTNLHMGPDATLALAARGRAAAQLLDTHFHGSDGWGWRNHQWVRLLRLLGTAQPWLADVARGTERAAELNASPPSYLGRVPADILPLVNALAEASKPFERRIAGFPNPPGTLRVVPRLEPESGALGAVSPTSGAGPDDASEVLTTAL